MHAEPTTLSESLIDVLLAQSSHEARQAIAREEGVLTYGRVDALLELAADEVGADPGHARKLAQLAEDLAAGLDDAPDLAPRAMYLRAQTHAINAEYKAALALIDHAHHAYADAGLHRDALRTHIGRIRVLQELGDLLEALRIGQHVLDALADAAPDDHEAWNLAARAHQNMGLCYEQLGRYPEALAAYDAAERGYVALGLHTNIADVANDRGVVYLFLGRGRDALTSFEAALRSYDSDLALKRGQTLTNAGNACLLIGDYARGLAAFEEARATLAPIAAEARKFDLLIDVAEAHLRLNLLDDALNGFQQTLAALNEESHNTHNRARALWGAGAALAGLARWEEAAQALSEAVDLFTAAQNAPMQSAALLQLAAFEAARGARRVAIGHARAAHECVSHADWPLHQAEAHLMLARLVLPDDLISAEAHLNKAQPRVDALGLPALRYAFNRIQASCALARNDDAAAEALLRSCVDGIAQLRSGVSGDQTRTAFGLDKTSASDDLVNLYLQRAGDGDAERAWLASEHAKGQVLIALDVGSAHSDDSDEAHAISARRNELHGLYSQLLDGGAQLREHEVRARTLEREIARLELRREARAAEPAAKVDLLRSAHDLRETLGDDVTMVAYHIIGDALYAFVVEPHAVRSFGLPSAPLASAEHITGLMRRLSNQWDRFRAGQGFVERHLRVLEQSSQRVLGELYDALLRPLEAALAGRERVVVVPHGVLHQVPFHALFDGERYAIETHAITYAPSATMLRICASRRAPTHGHALVVGVADPTIPFVESEARAIAAELQSSTLLLNEQATREAVLSHAHNLSHLHLACHGLFRPGSPMFSSLKLHDGWLLAMDAARLQLTGAHVTLSACESGRSLALAGDEIVGLSRAFLAAGAKSLTVSLWLAHDESAAELMREWHRALANGMCRAKALRTAQRDIAKRYPHPYFWAPFVLLGL
jgi:tetratricopeptide (TPR) repeat protein